MINKGHKRVTGQRWLRDAGVAAVLCWSDFEETSYIQGQRGSPSKTVGWAKSCSEQSPIPAKDTQRAQINTVSTRTQRPPQTLRQTVFKCLLQKYGSVVNFHRGRSSGCSSPGYGISPLGGDSHELGQRATYRTYTGLRKQALGGRK